MRTRLGFISSSAISDARRIASRWRRLALPCIIAIALRLTLIAYTPAEGVNASDINVYHTTAIGLAKDASAWFVQGGEFGYRAPLYFAYLAMVYGLTGHTTYHAGQVANLLLIVLLLLLLYLITQEWFGDKIAILSVWARAMLPTFVVSDILLMSEPLFDVCLLGVLKVLLPYRTGVTRLRSSFILEFIAGAATLTREFAIGLVVLLLGIVMFEGGGLKPRLAHTFLMLAGVSILVLPWMWRNVLVWQSPLPLALTSGVNLYIGNHPEATGTWVKTTSPSDFKPGTPHGERWHREQAIRHIVEAPSRFFLLGLRKIRYLVWPYTLRDEIVEANFFPRLPRRIKVVMVGGNGFAWAVTWLLGLIGLFLRRVDQYSVAVIGISAYTGIVVFVSMGAPRFADPLILLLLAPAIQIVIDIRSSVRTLCQPGVRSAGAWGICLLLGISWVSMLTEKLAVSRLVWK